LGTASTIGILANPRYTHFMNAAAHRGAHDGHAESFGIVFSRVPGLTALQTQSRQTSPIK